MVIKDKLGRNIPIWLNSVCFATIIVYHPIMLLTNETQMISALAELDAEGVVYFSCSDEILDFTDKSRHGAYTVALSSKKGVYEFLVHDEWAVRLFVKAASMTVFSKGKKVIAWDWKNFCSFCLGRHGVKVVVECSLIDLKIIEHYVGFRNEKPKTVGECTRRLRSVVESGCWDKLQVVYKSVYLPLACEVLPCMETIGILDREKLHAHYDIAGQENGRLLCFNAYSRGYVPHVLTQEQKGCLKPIALDQLFVYLDYRSMEVRVLEWLTKDTELTKACESPDIYKALYETVTKNACDSPEKRSFCKSFFLPVFYGMSPSTLSERLGVSQSTSESIVDRIRKIFPTAYGWVERQQAEAKDAGLSTDLFGRRRVLEDKHYRARNFAVQSPAALFCLKKLVHLHESLKGKGSVAYNVHDGYMIYSSRENVRDVVLAAMSALRSEDSAFPSLRMEVSCSVGRRLTEMRELNVAKKGTA